jgi:hypothetical protein
MIKLKYMYEDGYSFNQLFFFLIKSTKIFIHNLGRQDNSYIDVLYQLSVCLSKDNP